MSLAKPIFQQEVPNADSFTETYQYLKEKLPKSALTFLYMINEQLNKLAYLSENGEWGKAEKAMLNTLLEHLIRLLELPLMTGTMEVNRKIERLLMEVAFKKKHLWQFEQLTPREKEVLSLLGQGCSNKEIASRLSICTTTVQYYRKIIKSKLSAASTADLVKYSLAFNLI